MRNAYPFQQSAHLRTSLNLLSSLNINTYAYQGQCSKSWKNYKIIKVYSNNFNGLYPQELYDLARDLFKNIIGGQNWIDIEFGKYPL